MHFQRASQKHFSRNKSKKQERRRCRIQTAEDLPQEKGRRIVTYCHIKTQDDSCTIDMQINWTILEQATRGLQ